MDVQPSGTATDDTLLAALVSIAEKGESVITLTLQIGGVLVSGKLVGRRTYLDGIVQTNPSLGKEWDRAVQSLRDEYGVDSSSSDPDPLVRMPVFIHMRDVRFYPATPQASASWWRGRSSAIEGWFIGQLER